MIARRYTAVCPAVHQVAAAKPKHEDEQ